MSNKKNVPMPQKMTKAAPTAAQVKKMAVIAKPSMTAPVPKTPSQAYADAVARANAHRAKIVTTTSDDIDRITGKAKTAPATKTAPAAPAAPFEPVLLYAEVMVNAYFLPSKAEYRALREYYAQDVVFGTDLVVHTTELEMYEKNDLLGEYFENVKKTIAQQKDSITHLVFTLYKDGKAATELEKKALNDAAQPKGKK